MKRLFLLSLFSVCCRLSGLDSEGSEVTGSVGEDVILPCRLNKSLPNLHKLLVEWKRNGTDVHTYRSRADDPRSQCKSFENRTRLFHNEMVNGNMSLKLFNVTKQDEGIYTCSVRIGSRLVKKGNINLKIVPKEQDLGRIVNPTSGPDTNTDENLSLAAIGGIVPVPFIAFGIGILICIVNKRQRRKERKRERQRQQEENGVL